MNERKQLFILYILVLQRKKRLKTSSKKRRWGIRPVLRTRKQLGEYYSSFLKYKIVDHEWFFLYTRMTPDQFDKCITIVGPLIQKFSHREPLSASQRLAVTLRYLSQGDSMFSIASGYKIGRSTVSAVIRETTEVIWISLNKIVLKPLTSADFKAISENFFKRWNLPHVVGALDGKHIAIKNPNNAGSNFFNYKKHFSIVLLAMCDAHYNFTYVDIGAYGSQSDGGVLSNSTLGKAIQNGTLPFPADDSLPESNINMPYFIVGDDAFSLGKRLMKPYKGYHLTEAQSVFNYRLSRARRVIENAFGILVARWRIFTRTISSNVETVDNIIKATVCLHNFIKIKEFAIPVSRRKYCPSGFCDRETDDGIISGEWRVDVGSGFNVLLQDISKTGCGGNNPGKNALNLREQLTQYLISPAGALPGQIKYVNRGKKQ